MGAEEFDFTNRRYMGDVSFPFMEVIAEWTGLDRKYLNCLDTGFEGLVTEEDVDDLTNEWKRKGFEDGIELRRAVVKGQLPGNIRRHDRGERKILSECVDNVVYGVVRDATPTTAFVNEVSNATGPRSRDEEDPAYIEGYHQTGALN